MYWSIFWGVIYSIGLKLKRKKIGSLNWIVEYQAKCWKRNEKTLKIALKLPKSPNFFHFLEKNLS